MSFCNYSKKWFILGSRGLAAWREEKAGVSKDDSLLAGGSPSHAAKPQVSKSLPDPFQSQSTSCFCMLSRPLWGSPAVCCLAPNNFSRREQEHPWEGKDQQVGNRLLHAPTVLPWLSNPVPRLSVFSPLKTNEDVSSKLEGDLTSWNFFMQHCFVTAVESQKGHWATSVPGHKYPEKVVQKGTCSSSPFTIFIACFCQELEKEFLSFARVLSSQLCLSQYSFAVCGNFS